MGRKQTLEQLFWEWIGYQLGCTLEGGVALTFPDYAEKNGFDRKEADEFFNTYEPD